MGDAMITTIALVLLAAVVASAAALLARRRRIQIERFAELAGVRRGPGESDDRLLERAAWRFRGIVARPPGRRSEMIGVAGEDLEAGDLVSVGSDGRIRRG